MKSIHREMDVIFLKFSGRSDWLKLIKTLPQIRYTRTYGYWYIPYTKDAYNSFLKLDINYHIKNPSPGTTEDIASKGDHTGINSFFTKDKELTSVDLTDNTDSRADIHDNCLGTKIDYNSGKFYIYIHYNKPEVEFIKTLEKAWWSTNNKSWIVQGSLSNFEALQKRYNLWNKKQYSIIGQMIRETEDPCTIELYVNPAYADKICIKAKGYQMDVDYLKHIQERKYTKNIKQWIIPHDKDILERLITHYQKKGTKIINRISNNKDSYRKEDTPYKQLHQRLLGQLKGPTKSTIEKYINTMTAQRYSTQTIKSYSVAFLKYLTFYEDVAIEKHTSTEVNRYLAQLSKKNLSHSSVNISYSAIKYYFEKIVYIPTFDFEKLRRPRKGKSLPTILSIQEVDRILRSTTNLKHTTLLYTLYSSGMRLSEILNTRVQDIHWDRNQIHIVSGKGNKDRMIMLSKVLKDILRKYFDEYTPIYWLFEGADKKTQYSQSSVQKIVKKAAREASVTRKVSPHTMRHCFATHLLDNGTDIRYIQELLGHKDIKTTLIYTHVTTRKIKDIESPLDRLFSIQKNINKQ